MICPECNYRSNMEDADCIVSNQIEDEKVLEEVHTPGYKTIEDVCAFLNKSPVQSCKAVLYQKMLMTLWLSFFCVAIWK